VRTLHVGWSLLRHAFQTSKRNVQDAWILVNRIICTVSCV
jgi:hypothetical protein